jgi:maltose alpha-D-glucosyltransferase/alpha-amylase
MLLRFVTSRRWFRGKARTVKDARIVDRIPIQERGEHVLMLFEIDYIEGESEIYLVPLVFHAGLDAEERERRFAHALITPVEMPAPDGSVILGGVFDAVGTGDGVYDMLDIMAEARQLRGQHGRLSGEGGDRLRGLSGEQSRPSLRVGEHEQSNSVVTIGETTLLKAYRQLTPGTNPEIEIGTHLATKLRRGVVPCILGTLQYERPGQSSAVVAFAQEYIVNEGNFWNVTLDEIERFFERVLAEHMEPPAGPAPTSLAILARTPPPEEVQRQCGHYLTLARLLGQRTAEVHVALADSTDPVFAPQPFSTQHQQSIYQWSHASLARTFEALRRKLPRLPNASRELAQSVIAREQAIDDVLRRVVSHRLQVQRIRCHGDLHLAQVLFTGNDFVIIDFEGEPARPLNERRYKMCALRDVVGMMRSFSYVTEVTLRDDHQRPQDVPTLAPWAQTWSTWVSAAYLGAYLESMGGSSLVPAGDALKDLLLDFYELEKAIYELEYELNNRPDWVDIPLRGLSHILQRRSLERTEREGPT